MKLAPRTVAEFYPGHGNADGAGDIGVDLSQAQGVDSQLPFDRGRHPPTYDAVCATRWWSCARRARCSAFDNDFGGS